MRQATPSEVSENGFGKRASQMGLRLSAQARREVRERLAPGYQQASASSKGALLDEVVATTGYARRSAMRLLNRPPAGGSSAQAQMPDQVWTRGATGVVPALASGQSHWHQATDPLPADVARHLATASPAAGECGLPQPIADDEPCHGRPPPAFEPTTGPGQSLHHAGRNLAQTAHPSADV
jgi:hypothetical protein